MRFMPMGFMLLVGFSHSFIVPQELPSILSLVYSNIPPIKKGTDSRVGFGFRLGEHADFQVQLELGPQKFTKPIGNGGSDDADTSDTSKRMVDQTDFNKKIKPVNSSGTQWLNNWAADMKIQSKRTSMKQETNGMDSPMKNLFTTADQYPIPMSPVIAESSLRQLQQLYGNTNAPTTNADGDDDNNTDQSLGTLPANSMTSHIYAARQHESRLKKEQIKADLMDVSLDE